MKFSKRLLAAALSSAVVLVSACAHNPGGFTAELKPVNVAGHDVRTVVASAWMQECFGQPDQMAIMLTQFEHIPGRTELKHISTGTVITQGDCHALLGILGTVAGAVIVADGLKGSASTTYNNAAASSSSHSHASAK